MLLIKKLRNIGLSEKLLKWLLSFLDDRRQVVKIGYFISKVIKVCSWVPQSGQCSPLLFNLLVNDLKNVLKYCEFLMFANDLKLFSITVNELDISFFTKIHS